jgi:hypothetical protein
MEYRGEGFAGPPLLAGVEADGRDVADGWWVSGATAGGCCGWSATAEAGA